MIGAINEPNYSKEVRNSNYIGHKNNSIGVFSSYPNYYCGNSKDNNSPKDHFGRGLKKKIKLKKIKKKKNYKNLKKI